ncbi:hypothetical protein [Patulibacter defluvii]|uniref:hypothetical protein n=1 Tax=Patulibacter defluvii TaxID=3095358 RepID=UPI002A75493C|nr:hypothetical protein [Patulibacter sp. DM4]
MIELKGLNGESLIHDGATLAKFRHGGREEAARNPLSTFREAQVKHKPGKRGKPGRYEVLIAMAAFFALSVEEERKPELDALIAALESGAAA